MSELDPEALRLLSIAREVRTPSEADKARVERLLGGALLLGAPAARAARGVTTTRVVGSMTALKWTGAVLLAVAAGTGYCAFTVSQGSRRAVPERPAVTRSAPALAASTKAAIVPPGEASGAGTMASPRPSEPVAPSRAPQAASLRVKSGGQRAASGSSLEEELDLLHDAQSKWRAGNASAALSILAEHRARYPRSALSPERDALTILSLCATNRVTEARRMARRFLEAAKGSPLRTSVEESCGGK